MNRIMKNRLIAVFLIAVILLTGMTVVQPETAQAASKITLKSGAAAPSTIYAGHTYNLKVAGRSVKFVSSNKKVATIGATTGKMKAIAHGTVKITAKNKKTGKAVASKTFKVLQRAKSVTTNEKEIWLEAVGDTTKIKATLTPSTSTDVIRFVSSDKTIATVGTSSGKVTGKAGGTTTIMVYAKATKDTANKNKSNKVAEVKVIVGQPWPAETMLVYFDAGDFGVVNVDAACRELKRGTALGELPTSDDILMNIAGDENYELTGWATTKNAEIPDVTKDTTVTSDLTLYAVWKKKE